MCAQAIAAAALLLVISTASDLRGQSPNASLAGRVTDSSKSVIVAASIAAIGVDTNARHETATNTLGEYSLTNLPPNRYRIEVEKPGFEKLIKPDVIFQVQDAATLDFELTLGSMAESITIEGGASQAAGSARSIKSAVRARFS